MKAAQFIQAPSSERTNKNLRPYDEFNLKWDVDYNPDRQYVSHDDAGNKYTITDEDADCDFPILLTITPPSSRKGSPLYIRCSWYSEATSYAEDFNWNRKIGYVCRGHIMGTITTCWH